ncbi:lactate permease LctP family transporter [Burkholderia cenocepacia]|uniref:L-lactate permease n=1 Tax=Burkholderia cenocepacia TaxID=95486 RepID=A0A1V2W6Q1_9BURK|nr:lactate permease LctP family transporter [Burkholderia cenocepacia]MBR8137547.1 lactate permease LctP family transporter [Burkholderia cenocepacia]MBR8247679.1 lactate permease LctP family transporter [Burkholderia cenocepacia]MBR8287839.1 lactate permease LctP family transporter [Burkholderia cenocepacia]MBR8500918.1 lactate permease LctP family transporter [Burkholderia cenocepacia]MCO8325255.1 lactate permease LctP family transporter [Burkholderia cenocepacia]
MQVWHQIYTPLGSLGLSAFVAAIPIIFFFVALAALRMKGHVAAAITLLLSLGVAILAYGMPVPQALAAAGFGFAYGLWPIAWIIVAAVFLYKIVVKTGQFDIIRASVLSITDDQRLQMLLIGFSFGAFLEGAAGFGAPVAITAALLVGLGFKPLHAAGLCLIANTAPVAFGAMGIPIIVAGQVTGIDAFHIGAMAGRQLPLLSLAVPFWLVFMMDGLRGVRQTWPAALVAGGSFAVTQYFTSNHIGPELPDITSSLVSLVALAAFLKVWQPSRAKQTAGGIVASGGGAALAGFGTGGNGSGTSRQPSPYTLAQTVRAWSPFLILTAVVTVWSIAPFKALFAAHGALVSTVLKFHVAGLDQLVVKTAPIAATPKALDAVLKIDLVSAVGSAILVTALISMALLRMKPRDACVTFGETLTELTRPILSIGLVLAFAFVANYSGMSSTLALMLAGTGAAFPFFSPFLGWLGVFLTGSDTSSNALFCSLQQATAHQLGVPETLAVAANTTGGVTAKMISPQSIAVACAATGLVGKESELFRFTVRHSLLFAVIVGLITLVQAYVLPGMVP